MDSSELYAEYVGLTAAAVAAIERFRVHPNQSRSDIILRALSMTAGGGATFDDLTKYIDYGEGIKIRIGEPLFLFLSKTAKVRLKPDARAEIRPDGFYLEGERIGPPNKRLFQPAMQQVQARIGHRNPQGVLVSLSAIEKWHVRRDGELRPLTWLKDPALARRRGRIVSDAEIFD